MWRISRLSLRTISGTEKQKLTHLGYFFSSLFLSLLLFVSVPEIYLLKFLALYVQCFHLFVLYCFQVLWPLKPNQTKPNLTKQATEEYLEKTNRAVKRDCKLHKWEAIYKNNLMSSYTKVAYFPCSGMLLSLPLASQLCACQGHNHFTLPTVQLSQ